MKNGLLCKLKLMALAFAAGCAVATVRGNLGGGGRRLKRCVHNKLDELHSLIDAADRAMREL